jgi:uncharacterized protein (DUF362 family)
MAGPFAWRDDPRVAVVRGEPRYPSVAPYPPSDSYPEWPGGPLGTEDNPAFRAVRSALQTLGLDAQRYGTSEWNPLRDLIRPGETVVLKPNLVLHENLGPVEDTDCLITHGSVIRAVMDYVGKALGDDGEVIVGDCPIQDADWTRLVDLAGLDAIAADFRTRFPGLRARIEDYRLGKAILKGRVMVRRVVEDDDDRSREVDLGEHSMLVPITQPGVNFGVSRYPRHRMRRAHSGGRHLYLLASEIIEADVVINLPKMKSHMKAGITCALKNFVGLNRHKDYLPHFRFGSPRRGGDEHPDGNWFWDLTWYFRHRDWDRDRGLLKLLFWALGAAGKAFMPVLGRRPAQSLEMGGGGWHGNDTIWRMILDINRAFFYYDASRAAGIDPPKRRYLALLDGLIGGHRESPLAPSPVPSGLILAGFNPVATDLAAAALMRLDWRKLPQLTRPFEPHALPLVGFQPEDIRILGLPGIDSLSDIYARWSGPAFDPSMGYRGEVEFRGTEG